MDYYDNQGNNISEEARYLAALERVAEVAKTIHGMEYLPMGMWEELGEALMELNRLTNLGEEK